MKTEYRERLERLLARKRLALLANHGLQFKNCFGAVAGYVGGQIFVSCGKFGVALRLPQPTLAALFQERDVRRLRYFTGGHVKKEYAVIPRRIIDDENRFHELLVASLKYSAGCRARRAIGPSHANWADA